MDEKGIKPASIAASIRAFLAEETGGDRHRDINKMAEMSVQDIAQLEGLALKDFVSVDPERAIMLAEQHLTYWRGLLKEATLTGIIMIDEESKNFIRASKDQVTLLQMSIKAAEKDVEQVYALCTQAGAAGEERKSHLIRVLYNKAIGGDIRAIEHLLNRVDETESKLDNTNAGRVYNIICCLFHAQLNVLNSGSGKKIACTGRQAGKSTLACAMALIEALRVSNTTCLIIGKTMKQEESIINTSMNILIADAGLTDDKGKRLDWRHLDNGSKIIVRGLNTTKDPDTIRGLKPKVIILDEFFHMNDDLLGYLQSEVLDPMQLTYGEDYIQLMIGTPPRIKNTYGEKVWKESPIPHFEWTGKDNPYVPDFDAFVQQKAEEKGVDIYAPEIRREYFGEWVYDTDALVFPDVHYYTRDEVLPQLNIDYVLCGIDYGMSDNDTLIAVAWDKEARRGFVFYESKFNRLTINKDTSMLEQLKKEVKALWKFSLDFFPQLQPNEANKKIYWQADTSDQQLTQELLINVHVDRLRLNIGNAHKHDKFVMIDKMRDLFRTGALLLPEGGLTLRECEMTVYKRDALGNIQQDIDDRTFHPDLLDALRYALWPIIGAEEIKGETDYEPDHVEADHLSRGGTRTREGVNSKALQALQDTVVHDGGNVATPLIWADDGT